jgi:hypothetical protein
LNRNFEGKRPFMKDKCRWEDTGILTYLLTYLLIYGAELFLRSCQLCSPSRRILEYTIKIYSDEKSVRMWSGINCVMIFFSGCVFVNSAVNIQELRRIF